MANVALTTWQRAVRLTCLAGGVLLAVLGARYFWVPESAARTFGLPGRPAGYELHHIVGLRNVWLGLLVVGLAAWRQWHALALWFAIGTFVCFADATIAASSTGRLPQVAFHVACGVACGVLAIAAWRIAGTNK
jgi:hypothetical protein